MRLTIRRAFVLTTLYTLACDPTEPASAWRAPENVSGKADGIAGLRGEDIPSDFVDPTASYCRSRDIVLLDALELLAGPALDVAHRADGIIDAGEADGSLHVEELVRMGESPYFDLLHPAEQEALAAIWTLFELSDEPPLVGQFAALPPLAPVDRIRPLVFEPLEMAATTAYPDALEPSLQRLQLLHDVDGDDATTHRVDLEAAVGSPGPFTVEEIDDFEQALTFLVAEGTAAGEARIALPAPGQQGESLAVGPASLVRTVHTHYTETRHVSGEWIPQVRASHVIAHLRAERHVTHRFTLDAEQRLLLRPLQPGGVLGPSVLYDAAEGSEQRFGGTMYVEVIEGGARTFSGWLQSVPVLHRQQTETAEMDDAVLPAKETLDGQPLVLTAQSAEEERGTGGAFDARVVFTHELEPLDPPPGVSPSLVEAAALPAVQLPMGRYPVETSHAGLAFVEIYDRGAIRAVDQTGAGRWFEAATTQSDYIAVFPTQGGRHDRFALMDNGWLRAQTHGAEVETTELLLEAGDRLP